MMSHGDKAQMFPGGQFQVKTGDIWHKYHAATDFNLVPIQVKIADRDIARGWTDEACQAGK